MNFFNRLLHNFRLSSFRAHRDRFYDQIAKSVEVKDAFRDFLDAELRIALDKATADASRAYALKLIRKRHAQGAAKWSEWLKDVMPESDRLLLVTLDDAPDVPALLRTIASSLRERDELIGTMKKKVIPPLLVLPGAFAFAFIFAKNLPIIVKVAPPEVWNGFNGYVRMFCEFILHWGILSVAVFALAAAFFVYQLPRWRGTWRARLESVRPRTALFLFPVFPILLPLSLYRDFQAGITFSVLAVMLSAGRTLNDSLQVIERNASPWLRWHVRRILRHLQTYPTEYARAFSKGLISPTLMAQLSSDIRTTPRFDHVLINAGQKGMKELREVVDRQAGAINTVLLMEAGALVVFLMMGQLLIPMSLQDELSPAKQMARKVKVMQGSKGSASAP